MPLKKFDLEEAVRLYGGRLFNYAYALLCDYHEAEDVAQDTFVSAWLNRDGFDGKNLRAWLYRIAYNKSVDRLRGRREIPFDTLPERPNCAPGDAGYSPATINALARLEGSNRAVILMRLREELSYAEIAERLDLPEATLRKRYERAKKRLAAYLSDAESEVL